MREIEERSMIQHSTLVYLIGHPGTGKYTIAKEMAKAGYILCDNQLINNPIFKLVGYEGFGDVPEFAWQCIGKIREAIFEFIAHESEKSYVLTNVLYENPGDRRLFQQVQALAELRGSLFVPVKLLIKEEENLKRIQNTERRLHYKSRDPKDVLQKHILLNVQHPNALQLDVTHLTAQEAAQRIHAHIEHLQARN